MYKQYNMNQIILPLDLERKLEKEDIAFAIHDLVESIPEEAFQAFEQERGASKYHPRMMLKLILCAYTQSVFSGRKIEAMVKDSVRMMWLAQSYEPSYRTFNRFRVHPDVQPLLRECFIQFRNQLVQENCMDEEAIFIDGTKIEANANKYTFVWKKSIQNYDKKLTERSNDLYEALLQHEIIPAIERESEEALTSQELANVAAELDQVVDAFTAKMDQSSSAIERKEWRSKRKTPKKFRKLFQDFARRKENYRTQYQILGERNSYSKTDFDATFMRMKDDHMRNGQLKAGYNLQIATNRQFILGYDIFPNPTDTRTLRPFLQTLQNHFLELPTYLVADAGYGSEANYEMVCDEMERIPLITYGSYRKEQKKIFQKNPFHSENWPYQELEDTYLCPNGQKVRFKKYSIRQDRYGLKKQLKLYECEDCSTCVLRTQCTKVKEPKNRILQKNMSWEYFKAYIKHKLSEEKTGQLYRQRKIDVEPAFAYLKAHLRFTRLSVRGKNAVRNELGFALMAVNLRKYAANGGHSFIKKWVENLFSIFYPFFIFS